jgi:hypothetical protein
MTAWDSVPMTPTAKGVKIDLDAIYYYPHAADPENRGHGYLQAGDAKSPFEDEIELFYGLSCLLRRAKQTASSDQ